MKSDYSFKDEIDDQINDVQYGVDSVEVVENHPSTNFDDNTAVLNVVTKEGVELLIEMCLHSGFKILSYNNSKEPLDTSKSFDALSNLIMNYSEMFRIEFSNKLIERLSGIKS
ncbi:hypothetical protein CYY_003959 [Polysphondylium violaceum]|uniref:GSKIP domain-containing protein n=1 Tax=Polysphondylium violaceum TaxID=133409 RepID=A0A8J4PY62_9MYCE|nr:hypothetical protein CYY_003959 [Polysphondylium violaceum]